jgi:hypothetical protein
LAALCAILAAEGGYAVHLNREFYRQHIPILDSCSYDNYLAVVLNYTHAHGIRAALDNRMAFGNVALPWLEAMAISRFTGPSRELGVWLQWIWLWALAVSLYWYFTRYRGVPPWRALSITLPFVCFESALHWAGGLEDFRMDFSLYIFLALASVWFLIARQNGSRRAWLLAGAAGSLACLARATAPVYLAVMLGPLLAVEIVRAPKSMAKRLPWMAIPYAAALWFLLGNYAELHFYYAEWSPDANRHLPLRQALMHGLIGLAHLGIPLLAASIAALALAVRKRGRVKPLAIDWRLAWLAASPAFFLILRGAGLNPYVSMPCVFGVLMFAFFPWWDARGKDAISRPVCALAVAACLLTAATANLPHPLRGVNPTRAEAMHSLIDRILDDARARGLRDVTYGIPGIGDFHSCAFANTLIFDYKGTPGGGGVRLPSGASLAFPDEGVFGASDAFLWDRYVPGKTDALKMDFLVGAALARERYLLLPDERGLEFLERKWSYNFCNLKVRELKRRLLATGRYAPLGEPAGISAKEWIQVYVRLD